MKYCVILCAFAAALVAAAPSQADKRQEANTVPVNEAAMTDANGNVVPFNAAAVYQANKEAGL